MHSANSKHTRDCKLDLFSINTRVE